MKFETGGRFVVCTWICTILTGMCLLGLLVMILNPAAPTTLEVTAEHANNAVDTTAATIAGSESATEAASGSEVEESGSESGSEAASVEPEFL